MGNNTHRCNGHHHNYDKTITSTRQIRITNRNISGLDLNIKWEDIQGNQSLIFIENFGNNTFIESEVPEWSSQF